MYKIICINVYICDTSFPHALFNIFFDNLLPLVTYFYFWVEILKWMTIDDSISIAGWELIEVVNPLEIIHSYNSFSKKKFDNMNIKDYHT